MKPEVISKTTSELGEGPLFYEGHFYWVDIIGRKIHKLTGDEEVCLYNKAKAPTSIVPGRDGSMYFTLEDGFYKMTVSGPERVGEFTLDNPVLRFNDGKCDASGNYWAGTMEKVEEQVLGSLYVLSPNKRVKTVLKDVGISNGLCWNEDMSIFYFVDSMIREVKAYKLNGTELSSPRTVYKVEEDNVFPDGMCIDIEGNLWLALWNGFAVICIDPYSGEILNRIEVPCKKVTSCCWGGQVFDELYITTASKDMTAEDWEKYPDSGRVFKVRPGIIGLPPDIYG